jgi:hypothetical protein
MRGIIARVEEGVAIVTTSGTVGWCSVSFSILAIHD